MEIGEHNPSRLEMQYTFELIEISAITAFGTWILTAVFLIARGRVMRGKESQRTDVGTGVAAKRRP